MTGEQRGERWKCNPPGAHQKTGDLPTSSRVESMQPHLSQSAAICADRTQTVGIGHKLGVRAVACVFSYISWQAMQRAAAGSACKRCSGIG